MNERIKKLTELTLNGDMYVAPVKTEFNREDLFLSKTEREVRRLCEYIKNQQPKLSEYSKMTGFFRCDSSIVGDAFTRVGHKETEEAMSNFFLNLLIICQPWSGSTQLPTIKKCLKKASKV